MLRSPSIVIGRTSATVPPQWSCHHKCVTVLHGRNVNKLTACNGVSVLSLCCWSRGLVVFPPGEIPVTTPACHRPLARLVTKLHGMVPLFIHFNWITGSESWYKISCKNWSKLARNCTWVFAIWALVYRQRANTKRCLSDITRKRRSAPWSSKYRILWTVSSTKLTKVGDNIDL